MTELRTYIEQNRERWLKELSDFLRIPSISTLPDHKEQVRRGAQFVIDALKRVGITRVELIETPGHPLIYAERVADASAPTVLCYAHYDVQPPDPLDEWVTPPFEPTVRNGNLYARGAVDDKGQLMLQLKAVEALQEAAGRLPVNLKFLIEGEEEVGSGSISDYVPQNAKKLAADVALICDTALFAPDLPTLCIGLRGMVYAEIEVEGPSHDLHSGLYGGVAPNPLNALAWILAGLKSPDGHIQLPGFYDRVTGPDAKERAHWRRLPFDSRKMLKEEIGAPGLFGENGQAELERMWTQPTLDVHGILGGYTGPGAKTVIPARATAKVSLRLVPDQEPKEVVGLLERRVRELAPPNVTTTVRVLHHARPLLLDPENRYLATAARVFSQVYGAETVFVRSGGSIPVVAAFDEFLKIPNVMMGFGLPDDNLHAPNEKFSLANFYRGAETVARFFEALAG